MHDANAGNENRYPFTAQNRRNRLALTNKEELARE